MIGVCTTNRISNTVCDTFIRSMSYFKYFFKNILYRKCTFFAGYSHFFEGKELATTIFLNSHLYILILYTYDTLPEQVKVVVKLYTLIWEVIGLNLGLNTGYPEVFHLFPQSLQAKVQQSTLIRAQSHSYKYFLIHFSRSSYYSTPLCSEITNH
jgi:hypothetical protein